MRPPATPGRCRIVVPPLRQLATKEEAVLYAYTFGQVMWTMFVFFAWVLFFWLLFIVFGDLFRRHDLSGWGKAGWTIFVIVLPFIGVFTYFIFEGKAMGERRLAEAQEARVQMDTYVRSVAGPGSGDAAGQIAKAKELLDGGAISQTEFDQLKAKALA
jgi:putative oligomerization/nucleic acid binding protein/phospholipase D-like protein